MMGNAKSMEHGSKTGRKKVQAAALELSSNFMDDRAYDCNVSETASRPALGPCSPSASGLQGCTPDRLSKSSYTRLQVKVIQFKFLKLMELVKPERARS